MDPVDVDLDLDRCTANFCYEVQGSDFRGRGQPHLKTVLSHHLPMFESVSCFKGVRPTFENFENWGLASSQRILNMDLFLAL